MAGYGDNGKIIGDTDDDISIGNYTVREVLMKNRTSVWRMFIIPRVRSTSGIINISPNTSEIFH